MSSDGPFPSPSGTHRVRGRLRCTLNLSRPVSAPEGREALPERSASRIVCLSGRRSAGGGTGSSPSCSANAGRNAGRWFRKQLPARRSEQERVGQAGPPRGQGTERAPRNRLAPPLHVLHRPGGRHNESPGMTWWRTPAEGSGRSAESHRGRPGRARRDASANIPYPVGSRVRGWIGKEILRSGVTEGQASLAGNALGGRRPLRSVSQRAWRSKLGGRCTSPALQPLAR